MRETRARMIRARGARLDVRKPLADIAVRAIAAAIRVRRRRLTHDRTEHTAWASVAIAMADDFRFRLLDHCSLNILSAGGICFNAHSAVIASLGAGRL